MLARQLLELCLMNLEKQQTTSEHNQQIEINSKKQILIISAPIECALVDRLATRALCATFLPILRSQPAQKQIETI